MPVSFVPRDPPLERIATLDGSLVKLFGVATMPIYSTVFFFGIDSEFGASVSGFDIASTNVFDLESERYSAGHWQLTAVGPIPQVPVPGSLWLVGLGIIALRFGNRSRNNWGVFAAKS